MKQSQQTTIIAVIALVGMMVLGIVTYYSGIMVGKAFYVSEAGTVGIEEAGIAALSPLTVGEQFPIIVKANVADPATTAEFDSVSLEFRLQYTSEATPLLDCNNAAQVNQALAPLDVKFKYGTSDDLSTLREISCSPWEVTVRYAGLCLPEEGNEAANPCSNALRGDEEIARFLFMAQQAGTAAITFPQFEMVKAEDGTSVALSDKSASLFIIEPDADRDGYVAVVAGGNDCNDADAAVHPGISEVCGDGVDNDCDGISCDIILPIQQRRIDAGNDFSLALDLGRNPYSWGRNDQYQLGDGTITAHHNPDHVTSLSNVAALAAGSSHALALKNDGTVWAWGENSDGQLGDGTKLDQNIPVQVSGLSNIVAIAVGSSHSLALRDDGTVWAWGANANGRLGDGSTTDRLAPVLVTALNGVKAIAAGGSHSLALKLDGTVWAWGLNINGQLGDNSMTNKNVPVRVSGQDGSGALGAITSIAAGFSHSLAIDSNGQVWAWGFNGGGQLGDGSITNRLTPVKVFDSGLSPATLRAVSIAAGDSHSLALDSSGNVWAWGRNDNGQLGLGSSVTARNVPVQLTGIPEAGTTIVEIAAGNTHSLALQSDGTVWAWGENADGQLGDGSTIRRYTPVKVCGGFAPACPMYCSSVADCPMDADTTDCRVPACTGGRCAEATASATTICRASTDLPGDPPRDPAESCDGTNVLCPSDTICSSGQTWDGTQCIPSGIDSDGDSILDGVDNCPSVPNANQFDADGPVVFSTKWGTSGSGDGQFSFPSGITVDSADNIYVADTNNNRIQKFDSSGSFITSWGSFGSGDGQFMLPRGIALDSADNVYVADTENRRIQKFDSSGRFITRWGSRGLGNGQFQNPWSITIDSADSVYVVDTNNERIQKFDSSGSFIISWGSQGSGDGQFQNPRGIAVDYRGNVYVADLDNNRIQKFDSSGRFITRWGSFGSDDGQFQYPRGIAVDSSNNVYVIDYANSLIKKFDSSGIFITKWGSFGSGDAQFKDTYGLAIDSAGNVYVADMDNNRIQQFTQGDGVGDACETLVCGDGIVDASEQCDGGLLGGVDCTSQGFAGGSLGCSASCSFDTSLCTNDGDGDTYIAQSKGGDDCNDDNAAIHPGAIEICGNTIDENCDGVTEVVCSACTTATAARDCDDGEICTRESCVSGRCEYSTASPAPLCRASIDAAGDPVRDPAEYCAGMSCPADVACTGSELWDATSSTCVECLADADCTSGYECMSNACVLHVNSAPTANAGADQVVVDANDDSREMVTVLGSAIDSDGTISTYAWNEGTVVLGNMATLSVSFLRGIHTLTFTATDNAGATASDEVVINVREPVRCTAAAAATDCDDGLYCTVDACDIAANRCTYTVRDIDDVDACTQDACVEAVGGVSEGITHTLDCSLATCPATDARCALPPEQQDNDGDSVNEVNGDCDDTDATINPSAAEICADGKDNNCDLLVDDADTTSCPAPVILTIIAPTTGFINDVLPLDAQVSAGTYTYSWDVNGDGTEDYSTEDVTSSWSTAGTYEVVLTATDARGTALTQRHTVTIIVPTGCLTDVDCRPPDYLSCYQDAPPARGVCSANLDIYNSIKNLPLPTTRKERIQFVAAIGRELKRLTS